jgi:ElaB/YqjD/DUF883 family membrane-anchored ribosome-binding protein
MASDGRHRATHEADLQSDVEALREDFMSLRKDLASLVTDAVEQGKITAKAARERLEAMANQGVAQAMDQAAQAGKRVDDAVRSHPLATIGIALGAGFLVAAWLRKRAR